jgi:sulfur-oxidizing protein SoxZ
MAVHTPRVRVPEQARPGEVIEIKALISHEMETGQRKDADGKAIPRRIIKEFIARFNGRKVFQADWYPSIAANPYQSFFFRASETGRFEFIWRDDNGAEYTATADLTVNHPS